MSTLLPEKFRFANVGYLNSVPYRALEHLSWINYQEYPPSECARMLFEGECDMAVIPVAEALQHGGLELLPYGVVADGRVDSVLLLADCSLEEIDTILLDETSFTSVSLLKVLLKQYYPKLAESISLKRFSQQRVIDSISGRTAGLLIGDATFQVKHRFANCYDLATLWKEHTTLPFVFAACAYRKGSVSARLAEEIIRTIEFGIDNRKTYARSWADQNRLSRDEALDYVENIISYRIDSKARKGLTTYHSLGIAHSLFPEQGLEFDSFKRHSKESTLLWGASETPSIPVKTIDTMLANASEGRRLSIDETLKIAAKASLGDIALAADMRRADLHPGKEASYIVDRNINYTNVCNVYCRFCAFYRGPGRKGGYILTRDQIGKKIEEMVEAGGIQILLQGGLNPELGIEYYEDLFRWIKEKYPVNLHALSSDEILHICEVSKLSIEATISRLIEAGLGSLPGGGAEILVDRVRRRIARLKSKSQDWITVHRTAHHLGITSTSTMMFGVGETWDDRLLHMHKIRRLQDETGGFTAFITWPFQEENTKLKKSDTSAVEYLKTQAISRLFLDNISNIQSSWVTQGPNVGEVALSYGANDFGSVMFEENVVSAAGTTYRMDSNLIEQHIRAAGFYPWQRNVHYKPVGVR